MNRQTRYISRFWTQDTMYGNIVLYNIMSPATGFVRNGELKLTRAKEDEWLVYRILRNKALHSSEPDPVATLKESWSIRDGELVKRWREKGYIS